MTKTPIDKNKYSEIGGNKSLMRLAERLNVPFSVAKIIHDHAQPEVTEEWIKEKADILHGNLRSETVENIKQMLEEAGVEVIPSQ